MAHGPVLISNGMPRTINTSAPKVTPSSSSVGTILTGKGVARYRALKLTCQVCPSKAKCCPNAEARKITHEEHEDARQVARDIAKTRQYDISMKLQEEGQNALRAFQTRSRTGKVAITGPMRRK